MRVSEKFFLVSQMWIVGSTVHDVVALKVLMLIYGIVLMIVSYIAECQGR